jgi:Transcriptional regulator containing an amidase domain and an AraC-type DNA-binding HTH domain
MKQQWKVGIVLFEHVDVLDYSGPFEVFSLTVREAEQVPVMLMKSLAPEDKPFQVTTISQYGQLVTTHNGLKIQPECSFDSHPQLDILIVPGGPFQAIKGGLTNAELLQWIVAQHRRGTIVASICSGAILLAEAGLLSGKKATTNAFVLDYLETGYPDVEVIRGVRYIDSEDVLTSAGVAAGIDLSFYIVSKLLGVEAAKLTSRTIEYPIFDQTLA